MAVTTPYKMQAAQNLLVAEDIKADYQELRATGAEVVRIDFPFGGEGWMTLRYDLTREFYNDPRFGIEIMQSLDDYPRVRQIEKSAGASFIQYDGAKHQKKRAVVMKHLTMKKVLKLQDATREMVVDALDEFEATGEPGGPGNIAHVLGRLLPVRVLCALLGAPPIEDPEVLEASYLLVDSRAMTPEDMMEAYVKIQTYFQELYAWKKENPGEDLLSALIHDTAAEDWTEEELSSFGFTLLAAGHDATGSMLNGILEWLSYEPELYERLRDEPEALPRAMEEFFRLVTVGFGMARGRIALEDIEDYGGVSIKKGEAVGGNIVSSHQDDRIYPHANEFDLDRENPAPHMAFGYGEHACVGAQLARMEIRVALEELFKRYSRFENVEPSEGWRGRRRMKGPADLWVTWERA
ncbi:cytochrome P450 [Nocardioides sp. YIM 152588]|uniref:cytochrome P450 n=1 Tax=Nocardioides sp. YIM 152588 TaxID=3158259 RepID=UPI0032E3AE54